MDIAALVAIVREVALPVSIVISGEYRDFRARSLSGVPILPEPAVLQPHLPARHVWRLCVPSYTSRQLHSGRPGLLLLGRGDGGRSLLVECSSPRQGRGGPGQAFER